MRRAAWQGLSSNPGPDESSFYRGKLQAARYYLEWELPQVQPLWRILQAPNSVPFDMKNEWF